MTSDDWTFSPRLRDRITGNLQAHGLEKLSELTLKPAAVSIILSRNQNGSAAFILTRRAARLRGHTGQWALPGGRLDHGETALDAAVREVREELGFSLQCDCLIGALDDYPTRSGYRITPFVFWIENAPDITPNPEEVQSVHSIAVAELAQDNAPEFVEMPESDSPLIRLTLGPYQIHAPTAAILYQFRETGLAGRTVRVADLEEPLFARR